MAIDKHSFKKMFPHLHRELEDDSSENKVSMNAVCTDQQVAEKDFEIEDVSEEEFLKPAKVVDKLQNFIPTAIDFIRRCDTNEQAQEIITYLQKKGELTQDHAKELECKLKREGVRGFGSKKEENYYFQEGGLY